MKDSAIGHSSGHGSTAEIEAAWCLLSGLFADTEYDDDELLRLGAALKQTGLSSRELERILRHEVAPVCGVWLTHPGAIGPWPQFNEEEVQSRIRSYVQRKWYKKPLFHLPLWALPGIRSKWSFLKRLLQSGA